ncbi:MAG: TadE/TadG family type IV pilus assembly protein [Acidimicrobiia bacterium]
MFGARPRRGRLERGAVLTEAAIITPLFVMLLFGIWTTARAWNIHNVLDHAAREAARYGAVDPVNANIENIAEGEVVAASFPWSTVTYCTAVFDDGTWLTSGTVLPSGRCLDDGTDPGEDPTTDDRVQVSLIVEDHELDFIFFDFEVDLSARAVARLEP